MAGQPTYERLALAISNSALAQDTAAALRDAHDWVPQEEAEAVVALGGDGFMLQTLHKMLDSGRILPVYGVNRGTMGFLMNKHRPKGALVERVNRSRPVAVAPLRMEAVTQDGDTRVECALNEVSFLRETARFPAARAHPDQRFSPPPLARCDSARPREGNLPHQRAVQAPRGGRGGPEGSARRGRGSC